MGLTQRNAGFLNSAFLVFRILANPGLVIQVIRNRTINLGQPQERGLLLDRLWRVAPLE